MLRETIELRVYINLAALVIVALLPEHEHRSCDGYGNSCSDVETVPDAAFVQRCEMSQSHREEDLDSRNLPILWAISLDVRPGTHNASNRSNHHIGSYAGGSCSITDGIDGYLSICQSPIGEDAKGENENSSISRFSQPWVRSIGCQQKDVS